MQPGSFSQLETLVQQGRLSVTFILGLARGGTTAFEKHLFRTLPYDANVNEPSLLGPPPDSDGRPVDRIEATFAQVLAAVHKAQQHREGMIRVIVKEVTNKVLLQLMPHWRQLAHVVLVLVRHPPLQFESRIKSILDRIESGALTSFGIDQYEPADSLTVHGHPLFQGTSNGTWKEAWTKMKRDRDFSALGSGLARVAALHPFCDWAECQRAMWKGHPAACAEWEGSQMSHFAQLPDELCEATLRWRLGWAPLQEQLKFLDEHPSVAIIDFSCFQMDPTSFVKQIHRMVTGYWGTAVNEPRGAAAESFDVCSTAACWDQDSWDKWYFKPCFSKAANSDSIEPMLKPPMEAAQLPKTLLPALEQAYRLYSELISDPRAIQSDPAVRGPFAQLDRVHDSLIEAAVLPGASLADVIADAYWEAPERPSGTWVLLCSLVQALVLVSLQFVVVALAAFGWISSSIGAAIRGKARKPRKGTSAPLHVVSAHPTLSVVIPVLNEASCIGLMLRSADLGVRESDKHRVELLLVDSGCTDGTLEAARRVAASADFGLSLRVVKASSRGRGPALATGAAAATGEIVLFVHADTLLPPDYHEHLSLALAAANVAAVAFGLQVPRATWSRHKEQWALSVVEWGTQIRSKLFELPFGDQALALTARRLERCGGVSSMPILEDVELVRRLSDRASPWGGAVVTLPVPVLCSPRRWMQYGLVKAHLINAVLLAAHMVFGVPASWLYRCYYGKSV